MSQYITARIASRPRSIRPASYGASYDSLRRQYEFSSEDDAVRFLLDCGYRLAGGQRVCRSSSSCIAHVGVRGMSYAFHGPRGDAALESVEID